MKQYDLCVIGGGPAGYAAAMRGLDLDKRVLLIEKDKLGGAGLHNGALSSKAMWEIAQDFAAATAHSARFGLPTSTIPFQDMMHRVEEAVMVARGQLEVMIEEVNRRHVLGHLDVIYGFGSLVSPTEVAIRTDEGTEHIGAGHIVLATGSTPRRLPNIPIDERVILTSDGIGALTDYPESMVVLGAGVIGCEFATIFSLLGRTKVYLIDKADRILPFEDEDVVKVVEQNLEAHGVHIHRNSSLVRMGIVDGKVEYELKFNDGTTKVFQVEKALVSVGREPNSHGLGLDKAGVCLTDRGHIHDEHKDTCTSVPTIYAVGDLTADIALVNVGELEGRYAVERIFGLADRELCYDNISTIMFLHPEVAGVGLNEIEARQKGIPYKAARIDYKGIPRAIAMMQPNGFIKLLISPDDNQILGMRALGEHASSAIQAVSLMIRNNIPITDLADLIHPHPSITEGIQECARALLGTHIRKGAGLTCWDWSPARIGSVG